MKKIIRKVEDIVETWKPSANQVKVLDAAINAENDNISRWFKTAGVDRAKWNLWCKNDRFVEWWNKEWNRAMRTAVVKLDKIGMENAKTDFRYWEVMQKKYGGYQTDKTGGGVNIMFNIPRPPEVQIIDGEES